MLLQTWKFFSIVFALSMIGCGEGEPAPRSYPVLDEPAPPLSPESETSATIIVEMIEVDGVLFSDWQLANTLEPTRATPLRRAVQDWLREERARLVETAVVHGTDGNWSEIKSVREIVYPTEYRYPVMTTTETTTDPKDRTETKTVTKEERMRGVAATGHAFATKEAGTSVRVESTVDPEARTVKIELEAEMIHHFESLGWETVNGEDVESFTTPAFDKNFFQTSLTLQSGVYGFVGSGAMPESVRSETFSNPIMLVFVRADLNQPDL